MAAESTGPFVHDPLAALLEKEIRILSRSPRFRVIFGMACRSARWSSSPSLLAETTEVSCEQLLPVINTYGLLILENFYCGMFRI